MHAADPRRLSLRRVAIGCLFLALLFARSAGSSAEPDEGPDEETRPARPGNIPEGDGDEGNRPGAVEGDPPGAIDLVPDEAAEEESAEAEEGDGAKKGVAPAIAAEAAASARQGEFSKSAYRFCHDPNYGRNGTEGLDFCSIFDGTSDAVCPEARRSCPGWKSLEEQRCDPAEIRRSQGEAGRNHRADRCSNEAYQKNRLQRRRPTVFGFDLKIPRALSYAIIAAGALLLAFGFVRSLRNAGWRATTGSIEADGLALSLGERELQALPEARSRVLLDRAERSLSRGEAEEAAILLHLAILRHLEDEGLARYHPSKTNGDYLRTIRRHSALARLFRSIANQTERIRFGDGRVEPGAIDLALSDARRILVESSETSARGAAAGPLLLAVSFLLSGSLGCGGDERDPAYYSRGPTGMSALAPLLRNAGLEVELSRAGVAAVQLDVGVVLLRTSARDRARWEDGIDLDALLDRNISIVMIDDLWQSELLLPVSSTVASGNASVAIDVAEPSLNVLCSWKLGELSTSRHTNEGAVRLPRGRRLVIDGASGTSTGAATRNGRALDLHPVLTYAGEPTLPNGSLATVLFAADRVVEGARLAGCLYVFSDRDLFTNASLTREMNARFVASFFAALVPDGRRILILDRFDRLSLDDAADEGMGPAGDTGPSKPLKASNMLPFILQAALTLIALYVLRGAAFGPLRDPIVREHKAFIEHVEALGRQYARTGVMGLTHSARSLARLVVTRHRDQLRGGAQGGWSHLADHLARKLDLDENDVRAALRLGIDGVSELGAPGPADPSPSSERMLRTLSRLLGAADRRRRKR